MSIETVSVEQINCGKYDEAEVKRWDVMGEWVWGEMSEVYADHIFILKEKDKI